MERISITMKFLKLIDRIAPEIIAIRRDMHTELSSDITELYAISHLNLLIQVNYLKSWSD